jgi:hypothetical protein
MKSTLIKMSRGQYIVMHPKLMHSGWTMSRENIRGYFVFDGTTPTLTASVGSINHQTNLADPDKEYFPTIDSEIDKEIRMNSLVHRLYCKISNPSSKGSDVCGDGVFGEFTKGSMQVSKYY